MGKMAMEDKANYVPRRTQFRRESRKVSADIHRRSGAAADCEDRTSKLPAAKP